MYHFPKGGLVHRPSLLWLQNLNFKLAASRRDKKGGRGGGF